MAGTLQNRAALRPERRTVNEKKENQLNALELEVQEIEQVSCSGCGTSSTHPGCTCPVFPSTTGSMFTAKTVA
jgi:hypothetical protein